MLKKGRGIAIEHTFVVKVQRIQRVQKGRFLRLTGLWPEGGGLPLRAMSFIMPPAAVTSTSSIIIRITTVHPFATSWPSSPKGDARSVTGLAFCVIWHDKHSGDWLTALASPYPASPDFPLCRGKNKTPRGNLPICDSIVSTGYSATVEVLHRTSKWGEVRRLACPLRRFPFAAPPNCGGWQRDWIHRGAPRPANPVTCFPPGKVVAPATKGGMHFLARRAVVKVLYKLAPSII